MRHYILHRLLWLLPVLLGITFVTFLITYLSPSDPAEMMLIAGGTAPTPELLAKMRAEMGLDRPFLVQYFSWLKDILRGDFGTSLITGRPVFDELVEKLPATLSLTVAALVLMLSVSVPLGILSAVYQNRAVDFTVRILSFVGVALPKFWLALILIYTFALKFKWFNVMYQPGLKGMVLPTVALGLSLAAGYIRQIRAAVLKELGEEYATGIRARGIREHVILMAHVLRNALISIVTLVAISMGYLLGGTTVIETVFSWPGMGKLSVDAIFSRDYPLIQGYVVWMAAIFVGVNLLADILCYFLDPRIRLGDVSS